MTGVNILAASAAASLLLCTVSSAFTAPNGLKSSHSSFVTPSRSSTSHRRMVGKFFSADDDDDDDDMLVTTECRLTPEGYGFSSPASRILKKARRGRGYYRASATDRVVDVIAAITAPGGILDVSLVYGEDDKLLGLFTETDYIKVSQSFPYCV